MNFNIIVAVWGEPYVKPFCNITLPSLAPDAANTADIANNDWKFLIYSPKSHHREIESAIKNLFPSFIIELIDYTPESSVSPHVAMSRAHHAAAVKTIEDKAWAVVVPPDAVFSSGALSYIAKTCGSGKRALMINGPRIQETSALGYLGKTLSKGEKFTGRQLSKLLMKHIHPEWHRYHWASTNFSTQPFALMWDAPDGWLCRNFHLHPLVIDLSIPRAMEYLQLDTIDGEFVGRAIGIWDDIHIVQDSDDLLMCTLTPDEVAYSDPATGPAGMAAVRWAAYEAGNVNALHRWYLTKATKIHTEDLTPEWREIEEETGHFIFEILSQHRIPADAAIDKIIHDTPQDLPSLFDDYSAPVTVTPSGTDRFHNVFEEDVRIVSGTQIQGHCFVGRQTELNDVTLYPFARVGRYCSLARNAAIGASNHPITGLTSSISVPAIMDRLNIPGVELGHDVWVGANATILTGVKVGHGAIIGANAIVTKDVRPYAIVIGHPARELRRRFPDPICDALLESRWWDLPADLVRGLPADDIAATLRAVFELKPDASEDMTGRALLEQRLASLDTGTARSPQEMAVTPQHHEASEELAFANERTEAVRQVLNIAMQCTNRFGFNRRKFKALIREASLEIPDSGPKSTWHDVLLSEARNILKIAT